MNAKHQSRSSKRSINARGMSNTSRAADALTAALTRATDDLGLRPPLPNVEQRLIAVSIASGYALGEIAIAAATKLPHLTGASFDAQAVEASQARIDALTPLATSVRELLERLDGAILAEKGKVGDEARRFYRVLGALEHTADGPAIAPFLATMRRVNRRFRTRGAAEAQAPQPAQPAQSAQPAAPAPNGGPPAHAA